MLTSLALACCLAWAPPATSPEPSQGLSRAGWYGLVGSLAFAGSYGTTTLVGAVKMDAAQSRGEFEAHAALAMPIAGPFIALGEHDRPLPRMGLAFAGATQGLGVALMTASAITGIQDGPRPRGPKARKGIGLGLLVSGSTTLAITYLATLSIGASFARDRHDAQQRSFGRRLRFPLVGGFAAMPKAERYFQMWSAGASSAVQIASAAAIVAGIAWRRSARRPHLSVLPQRNGMHVAFAMRF